MLSTYLWDQAIREGNPDDTGDERGAPEKEEVPVETSRLLQWELPRLCRQTADILKDGQYSDFR